MVMSTRAIALSLALILAASFDAGARTPTAEDMLNLRELGDYRGGLALSPDSARIAVFEREVRLRENDYRYRLIVLTTGGGEPRIVADAGDIILRRDQWAPTGASIDRPPSWSPDSTSLAYLTLREGDVELWRVRADGGAPEPIVTEGGDVQRFAWANNHSIIVETATPPAMLAAIVAHQDRVGFHPDDNFSLGAGMTPSPSPMLASRQFVVDLRTHAQRPATPEERVLLDGSPRPPGAISSDEDQAIKAWIAPRTLGDPAVTPRLGLYHSANDGRDAHMCAKPECTQHMLDAWTFGRHVLFRRMEGWNDGLTALYDWDTALDRVRLIRREDEELFSCKRGGAHLVCLQEAPTQPRRVVSIDPGTGALRPLYDPNPQWSQLEPMRVERIEVNDAYGNQSFAHLVFPAGYVAGRRYPVVVVQYRSRGFLRGGVGNEYPIYPLAGRGYFVLSVDRPEWRGAIANELTYPQLATRTALDNSENLMRQSALEAMLRELDRRRLSDPRHVGITGFSNGAGITYWEISNTNLFAAAVVSQPPDDQTTWAFNPRGFRNQQVAEGMGSPWDASNPWSVYWQNNIAVLHAAAIHTPLLMNLSESEANGGFSLETRLEDLHRPVDVYVYPGAFHVKWRPTQLFAAQNRAMDWLDFWLRGIEHNDPDDPDRLARWRALRDASPAVGESRVAR